MEALAVIGLGDSRWMIADAFDESDTPHSVLPSFYVNDFELSQTKPWKIARNFRIENNYPAEFVRNLDLQGIELSKKIYKDIFNQIKINEIPKIVLGYPLELSIQELGLPKNQVQNSYTYFWKDSEKTFSGASPELLFRIEDNILSTMALAGTAKAEDSDKLNESGKDLKEHKIVENFLDDLLEKVGNVSKNQIGIARFNQLCHFLIKFNVELPDNFDIQNFIREIHPTPAVGIYPREHEELELLYLLREQLQLPKYFAAPFGLQWGSFSQFIVLIRGIFLEDLSLKIPVASGLVADSIFEEEVRELELKLASIKSQFD